MTAPARLWLKIGEAASRLSVSPKELRYWESVIPEIRPRRSRGNLRYYHLEELPRLERIRDWLSEGLTVADCRQLLRTGELKRGLGLEPPAAAAVPPAAPVAAPRLIQARQALTALLARLQAEPPAPPRKRRRPPVKAKAGAEAVAESVAVAGSEAVAGSVAVTESVAVAESVTVAEPVATPRPPRKSRAKAAPAGEADGFGPLFDGI